MRELALVPRRLLWRVRRKLILSYLFIGAVPAALIVAFFLLGGMLLFAYVGSYLVHSEIDQLRERVMTTAREAAQEVRLSEAHEVSAILVRRQAELARLSPAASIALADIDGGCRDTARRRREPRTATAGPWAHLDPPSDIPAWIGCDGAVGLLAYAPDGWTHENDGRAAGDIAPSLRVRSEATPDRNVDLLVRAVAWADTSGPGPAVIADVPVDRSIRASLLERTSVQLTTIAVNDDGHVLRGTPTTQTGLPGSPTGSDLPVDSVSFLEYQDWTTGERATLYASLRVWIRGLYSRISAAQASEGRSLGQFFLIAVLIIGVLFLLIQFAAIAMGQALARSITGSVHELFTGTTKVRQGDFTHRISVTARDQLGELAESFNAMTASVESLLQEAGEKKRLEEELRIAHDIQMSLLPRAPASIPGLSLTAVCVPAREVGGDYYDVLPIDEHRLGLLVADVAGKGTSAALYMAELKGLVLSLSQTCDSPRTLLMTANRLIAKHLGASSFITMTYAVIDVGAGRMTYARAGHTPLLYAPGPLPGRPRRVEVLAPDGLVLGLKLDDGEMFERLLEERTIQLSVGDVCVFYTDGITEAMNDADECFGEHRLVRLIEEHADLPSHELQERVLRDVERFVAGAPQHDDMTMLLVKVDELSTAGGLLPAESEATAGRLR